MKKTLSLLFFLFFLTGCSTISLDKFSDSNNFIERTTGTIIWDPSDKTHKWIKKEDESWQGFFETILKWYKYTAIYHDLWIKISLNDPYTDMFYNIPSQPVFERIENKIHNITMIDKKIHDIANPAFFVEMFTKQTGENLSTIIKNKHLSSWCVLQSVASNPDINSNSFDEWSGIDIHIFFEILNSDENVWSDSLCKPDNRNTETPFGIYYFQSIYHQDRYYKISYPAACAPTCWMFTNIEFF